MLLATVKRLVADFLENFVGARICASGLATILWGVHLQEYIQLAPLSFDAATFEIWSCLLNGARLVVPQPQTRFLAELGLDIRDHGVSVLWLTAGLFNLMVD